MYTWPVHLLLTRQPVRRPPPSCRQGTLVVICLGGAPGFGVLTDPPLPAGQGGRTLADLYLF